MTRPIRVAAVLSLALTVATAAAANEWNDRTVLKFDAPMMVPGATLPPGTYVFKLADLQANRHLVQIMNEDESKLMATAQAIPTKRQEPSGDIVLKVNPTEQGAPAALKGWFYPGSLYGHEFVYPDKQAREIAERTKTLILSTDVEGSDMQKGKLYTYDAEGQRGDWREDGATIKEWSAWVEGRGQGASAKVAAPGEAGRREATAPIVRNQPQGMEIALADLEDQPNKYVGQTISVTGEVEEVLGPRMFKLDEPDRGDLDRELVVYLPTNLAALVQEEDRVTVTGTLKMLEHPEFDREASWLDMDDDERAELIKRPMLQASRIVGGNNNSALAIDVNARRSGSQEQNEAVGTSGTGARSGEGGGNRSGESTGMTGAVGTSGSAAAGAISDADALGDAGTRTIGRHVELEGVKVTSLAEGHGFWIESGDRSVFVVPIDGVDATAAEKQTVSIEGVVLAMPRSVRERAGTAENANKDVYIYATVVR